MRIGEVHRQHPEAFDDQHDRKVILHHLGIFLEDLAFLRAFDMAVEGDDALGSEQAGQFVHELEEFLIALRLEPRSFDHLFHTNTGALDDLVRVGDDEGAESGPADHHAFIGKGM